MNDVEQKDQTDRLRAQVAKLEKECQSRLVERRRAQLHLVLLVANPRLFANKQLAAVWRCVVCAVHGAVHGTVHGAVHGAVHVLCT